MDITFGFIALFISIIIPGLIFQRIYYYGEFSKQFTTKDPLVKSLVYSIIPGLVVQFICLYIYVTFINENLNLSEAFVIHQNLLDGILSAETTSFLDNHFGHFLLYSLYVFIFSGFFGYFSSRIIRYLKLDRRSKLFRFKNQWFYIFSGELFELGKFKKAVSVVNQSSLESKHVRMVFADVLVNTSDGTQLYTGYVVDYDLDSENINNLDKIYLLEAYRYKKTELKEGEANVLHPVEIVKKSIPGSVFILPVKDLVNINILYLTEEKKELEAVIRKKESRKRLEFATSFFVLVMTLFSIFLFIDADWIELGFYKQYKVHASGFDRVLAFLTYIQGVGLFIPSKSLEGYRSYKKNLKDKLFGLLVALAFFVGFNFMWIFQYFGWIV